METAVQLIDCPRDAMQGLKDFVPTQDKIAYLNDLLAIGFDTLDFGSFVSPKAIPQMADTAEVLAKLNPSATKLLAIIANLRGAEEAAKYPAITYIGYPFSISETFQQRNTNQGIDKSVSLVDDLLIINKQALVVYLSMGFGNPYQDAWNHDIVLKYAEIIANKGVKIISLADTVGTANPTDIQQLFDKLIIRFPEITFGGHFHSTPNSWKVKVQAAWDGGCKRFDGALKGYGGCPFAQDELVGNIATENILAFLQEKKIDLPINQEAMAKAMETASRIFLHQ